MFKDESEGGKIFDDDTDDDDEEEEIREKQILAERQTLSSELWIEANVKKKSEHMNAECLRKMIRNHFALTRVVAIVNIRCTRR